MANNVVPCFGGGVESRAISSRQYRTSTGVIVIERCSINEKRIRSSTILRVAM
jgi:hypothetical protein